MGRNHARIGTLAVIFASSGVVVLAGIALALFLSGGGAAAAPNATLAGHVVVFADSGAPSAAPVQSVRAQCPKGKGVIGGGHAFSNSGLEAFVLLESHPAPELTVQPVPGPPQVIHDGWQVTARRTDGKPDNWGVLVYAVCVNTE